MSVQLEDIGGENYRVVWKYQDTGTVSLRHSKSHASTCHFGMNLSTYDVGFAPDFGKLLDFGASASAMKQGMENLLILAEEVTYEQWCYYK